MTNWDCSYSELEDIVKKRNLKINKHSSYKPSSKPVSQSSESKGGWEKSNKKKKSYNKFGNKKTTVDNIKFDSKGEANYYCKLKLLKQSGEIKDFELQPKIVLQPSFKINGKTIRAINYIADFKVTEPNNHIYYVDFKSKFTAKNPVFLLKKKMLLYKYKDIDFRIEF